MKHITIVLIGIALSGCASLKDFQQMDSYQRAEYVCSRDRDIRDYDQSIRSENQKRQELNALIMLGYREQESCTETPVLHTENTCITDSDNSTKCTQTSFTDYKEVCNKIQIPIDYDMAHARLNRTENNIRELKYRRGKSHESCFSRVKHMPAEDAFMYYKSN